MLLWLQFSHCTLTIQLGLRGVLQDVLRMQTDLIRKYIFCSVLASEQKEVQILLLISGMKLSTSNFEIHSIM